MQVFRQLLRIRAETLQWKLYSDMGSSHHKQMFYLLSSEQQSLRLHLYLYQFSHCQVVCLKALTVLSWNCFQREKKRQRIQSETKMTFILLYSHIFQTN